MEEYEKLAICDMLDVMAYKDLSQAEMVSCAVVLGMCLKAGNDNKA